MQLTHTVPIQIINRSARLPTKNYVSEEAKSSYRRRTSVFFLGVFILLLPIDRNFFLQSITLSFSHFNNVKAMPKPICNRVIWLWKQHFLQFWEHSQAFCKAWFGGSGSISFHLKVIKIYTSWGAEGWMCSSWFYCLF